MSNLCSNYVTVTGNINALKSLHKQISDTFQLSKAQLTEDNWILCDADTLRCDYGLSNLQVNVDSITFNVCSRNSPPEKNFSELSAQHHLKIEVLYEEPGCQLYGRLVYEGGSCIEDTAYTEEQWLELYDEDYRDEKKRIEELPYEEFLEEYTDWDVYEEPKYSYLGKTIVTRIKDTDLPLFINVDWMDEETDRQYKARYSTPVTKEALS